MKKVLFTTALLLIMGLQLCFAQKSQPSDYNLRKAYELYEQNDEKEAMRYINQHISDNPRLSNGYIFRASLYQHQKKYGQALMDVNNAIKNWDKNEDVPKYISYWLRADIYVDMEMYDKAIANFTTYRGDYAYPHTHNKLHTAWNGGARHRPMPHNPLRATECKPPTVRHSL